MQYDELRQRYQEVAEELLSTLSEVGELHGCAPLGDGLLRQGGDGAPGRGVVSGHRITLCHRGQYLLT